MSYLNSTKANQSKFNLALPETQFSIANLQKESEPDSLSVKASINIAVQSQPNSPRDEDKRINLPSIFDSYMLKNFSPQQSLTKKPVASQIIKMLKQQHNKIYHKGRGRRMKAGSVSALGSPDLDVSGRNLTKK